MTEAAFPAEGGCDCRFVWGNHAGAGPRVHFVRGTLDDPDRLPPGAPAVPAYYDREAFWPADSLARRAALLARGTP